MTLRVKLSLAIVAVLGACVALDLALKFWISYPRFVAMERDRALDHLSRARAALRHQAEHLAAACDQWPTATDGCGTPDAVSMVRAQHNLDLFVDATGRVIWRRMIDVQSGQPLEFTDFMADPWATQHPLLARTAAEPDVADFVATEHGPLLVGARRIAATDADASNGGTRIIGRLLTADLVHEIGEQTNLALAVWSPGHSGLDAESTARFQSLGSDREARFTDESCATLGAYARITGFDGVPALWIETRIPRDITRQGRGALLLSGATQCMMIIAAITMLMGLGRRSLVEPIQRLTQHAIDIASSGDLSRKLELNRSDELGVLGRAFDDMLARLASYRAQLADISRQAGMAEVASGVLHNVGNVLNSVNVATDVLQESVRSSHVDGVARAAGLLREHELDLATFVGTDPRGRKLPAYLGQLGELLAAERRELLAELGKLKAGLDHMNQIVQAQHEFARPIGVQEPGSVSEIVESVIAMLEAGFIRHGIELVREIASTPTAHLDRQRLMQVIVNLLTNAKDALCATAGGSRRVTVCVRAVGERAIVEVTDTGVGIEPQSLTRIFTNGYSTKKFGGGYGLHYCALVVKEMGGELAVTSDGLGRGATSSLTLPIKQIPMDVSA